MPLSLDEVFHRVAIVKGEVSASPSDQQQAQAWFRDFVDQLTGQLRRTAPGDLTITHESVEATIEKSYQAYRRRKERAARQRRLQD